jgi:hypothetical protein
MEQGAFLIRDDLCIGYEVTIVVYFQMILDGISW